MLASLAFALTLQVPANVPLDAEVIYPVMPRITPITGANGTKVALVQSINSANVALGKTENSYESLSLYKNAANVDGQVELALVFESWRFGFGPGIKLDAKWADAPVLPSTTVVVPSVPEKGQMGTYTLKFNLPVKKQATYSLKLKFVLPVGKSGVDREERLVGYRVSNTGQVAPINQFRFAVQFSPETVFAPIEAKPNWGWQVGPDGAYLKLDGRRSDQDAVIVFRYYPPTF